MDVSAAWKADETMKSTVQMSTRCKGLSGLGVTGPVRWPAAQGIGRLRAGGKSIGERIAADCGRLDPTARLATRRVGDLKCLMAPSMLIQGPHAN